MSNSTTIKHSGPELLVNVDEQLRNGERRRFNYEAEKKPLSQENRIIYAIYDDEEVLLDAIGRLRKNNVAISEVYTPFPVHGLHKVLGVKDTRMAIVSFCFGITGMMLGMIMIWYMMIQDWPVNIGGKPNFTFHENLPSFIPVIFEITVLCAAHGMALTFLLRSKLLPGVKATNPFPETTSDRFAIEFSRDNSISRDELINMLSETGIYQVKEKEL